MRHAVHSRDVTGCWLDCQRCGGIIVEIEDGTDVEILIGHYVRHRDRECPAAPAPQVTAGINLPVITPPSGVTRPREG